MHSENTEDVSSENYTTVILKDLQMLQKEIQPCDVEEWLGEVGADSSTNEDLDDDQIITAVLYAPEKETEEEDDANCEPNSKFSHSDAKEVFGVALHFIEEQPTSMPMDVLWMKKWRGLAAKAQMSSLKQKNYCRFQLNIYDIL